MENKEINLNKTEVTVPGGAGAPVPQTNETKDLIVPTIPENVGILLKSLNKETTYVSDDEMPVPSLGSKLITNFINLRESCLIEGESGIGVRTAAAIADFQSETECCLIFGSNDFDAFSELWYLVGFRIPSQENILKRQRRGWVCTFCKWSCYIPDDLAWTGLFPDNDEITPVIASLKHDCKLKREMVKNNIGDLTGKTIIFKLVTLDKELVDVVTALLQHNIVIILINPEQKKVIDKNQYFQGLPCYHFPDPTLQFIIDLANFYNLGDFMSQRAILIAAILTKGNAKRFKDLIREAALTLQDGQTISESLIVKLGRTLITDIRNKVLVASLVSGSKVPAIIRKQVFVLFNEDITLKQISDILAERLAIEEASPGDILIGSEAIQEGTFQVISQPDISKSDRDLVNLVAKLSAQGDGVSLTELAKKTGRSKAGISGTVSRLIKLNYLKNLESSKGKSAQLVLGAVSLNK